MAQTVKESACNAEDLGLIPGLGRSPAHSSILTQRIPWTKESSRLQCKGSQNVGHGWVTFTFTFLHFQSQQCCISTTCIPQLHQPLNTARKKSQFFKDLWADVRPFQIASGISSQCLYPQSHLQSPLFQVRQHIHRFWGLGHLCAPLFCLPDSLYRQNISEGEYCLKKKEGGKHGYYIIRCWGQSKQHRQMLPHSLHGWSERFNNL